jgi:hypothetical protein
LELVRKLFFFYSLQLTSFYFLSSLSRERG